MNTPAAKAQHDILHAWPMKIVRGNYKLSDALCVLLSITKAQNTNIPVLLSYHSFFLYPSELISLE